MRNQSSASVEAVERALLNKYARSEAAQATLDRDGLIALLTNVPSESLAGNTPLLGVIREQQPDAVLEPRDHSIIASIDDCDKMIFALADLEVEIEQQLRFALPQVAVRLLEDPALPLSGSVSILSVMDHLVEAMIGWSAGLGKSGEKLYERTREVVDSIRSGSRDIEALESDLVSFLEKEQGRITKLEERLAASETGRLRSQQSKNMTANMINRSMADKKLTPQIISFLQGPWYDSVQLIVLTKGVDSEEWFRAGKLTETIIWTYQPIESEDEEVVNKEKQKLYRIIEHLPGEIHELLVALEHSTDAADAALESIEAEQVMIVSGQELEYAEFEPLDCDEEISTRSKVSRLLLRKVNAMEPGQWFLYESDDVVVRIKLMLKLEDVKQLLFTNRNGMKVMQRGFDELAYYLSSGVVKPLNHEAVFTTTFKTYYEGLVEEHERQQKAIAERKANMDREEQEREEARKREAAQAAEAARQKEEAERQRLDEERQARLEQAAEQAGRAENAEALAEMQRKVGELAIGAWLKLPGPLGELEECKLAVRIAASDKMIFVSRAGTKIGEYTSEQLVQLLVSGQGEVQDEGVEFEDTLAQVVSRLRQDRTKSYDDLTRTDEN